MRLVLIAISAALLSGCVSNTEQKTNYQHQEHRESQVEEENVLDHNLLSGIWGYSLEENASFWIENDSMYFLEDQQNPAPIQVKKDTLITDYGGFKTKDRIYELSKDSLVLINEFEDTLRFVRMSTDYEIETVLDE